MNVVLWILQVGVAFFAASGALWRVFNYEGMAKDIPSVQALSQGTWVVIGLVELLCAAGLLLPPLFGKGGFVAWAAALLTLEMLLVTALHARHFGLTFAAANPAIWSLGIALAAAIIAWGRFTGRPA
jgi:hypothetical protein